MKKTLALLTFLLSITFIFAQKIELKTKFGKISDEEIKMTSYAKDPDAPAVVLFNKGFLSWGTFDAIEVHTRIKIFKKDAYDQANFRVVYSPRNKQFVEGLKASCYNMENGKLVETKATSTNIFEEAINKDFSVKKITVPGVREGSIVELKYSITNSGVRDWEFQDNIPTIWSEYEMQIPEFYIFKQIGRGSTPYAVNESSSKSETVLGTDFTYNMNTYHWIQKDVPAIKEEKYMTSVEDYKTKLIFYLEEIRPPNRPYVQITGTWGETAKTVMDDSDFGDFITKKSAMKDELLTVVKPTMTPIEKVQAIYDYVGKTFASDDDEYNYSRDLTASISKLKEKKKVTASEKNLIFMNMLTNSGISVAPVMLRTRNRGHVFTDKAVTSRFNRTISHVKIDKDTFFVDAAGFPQGLRLLPFNDLSGYGIEFLGKEKYEIVSPQSKISNKSYNQANFTLDTEGALTGEINVTERGYEAFRIRKKIVVDGGMDKYLQSLLKEALTDGKIESKKFENVENLTEETFKGNVKIKTTAYVNKTDDKMYVNPFLCFGREGNPFKPEERTFDVDYGATTDELYQLSLTIPEGFKVEEKPKGMRLQTADGSIKFEYLIEEKGKTVTLNTKLVFKKANFLPEEYKELKELYAKMIAKMGEQIVLTKAAK